MKEFFHDLKKGITEFPIYQWGVGIGHAFRVKYSDSSTIKFLKRSILNFVAPVATAYMSYAAVLSALTLVTFPLAAAPLAALGAGAVGLLLNGITATWLAGMSEPGMKENVGFVKRLVPFKKKKNPYSNPKFYPPRTASTPARPGVTSRFKSAVSKVVPGGHKKSTPKSPKPGSFKL